MRYLYRLALGLIFLITFFIIASYIPEISKVPTPQTAYVEPHGLTAMTPFSSWFRHGAKPRLVPLSYRACVKRVVDGDTIVLEGGTRVRYIGIDAPESVHPKKPVQYMGKEAAKFNRDLVEGKGVRLEFDIQKYDRYGRLLAYVYTQDVFVNAEIVKMGYAQSYTVPPNIRHQKLFLDCQRYARQNCLGLWNKRR